MTGEIGTMALLALAVAALLGSLPAWMPAQALRRPWAHPVVQGQKGLALVQLGLAALAALALQWALLADDFSVSFVAANASAQLPWGYKVTAMWGAHEGSMLLWLLLLTLVAAGFAVAGQGSARAAGILSLLVLGFAGFTLWTSNPFVPLLPLPPQSGGDLNPLLQHPGMAAHPPLLYAGYLSLAPGYALAVDALLKRGIAGRERAVLRTWTLLAFALLTCGIGLGSWWAYNELGWGGWWFWDPVENVSLLPWLAAVALLHALRDRSERPRWILCLAVVAFTAGLFGAFAVRSGILVSVHSFAADPGRGLALLGILGLALAPLALMPWIRGDLAQPRTRPPAGSRFAEGPAGAPAGARETLLLVQGVLAATAFVVLLCGVLYPPLHSLLGGAALSVGAPYFEQLMAPLGLAAMALAAVVPAAPWRRAMPSRTALALASTAAALLLAAWILVAGMAHAGPPPVAVLATWMAASVFAGLVPTWMRQWQRGKFSWPLARMSAAHLGAALVVLVAGWETSMGLRAEVVLGPGESFRLGESEWRWQGERQVRGANWSGWELRLLVDDGGETVPLAPQKRHYRVRGQSLSEVAVASLPGRDYYASLGERLEQGWTLRVFVKPLLSWLWVGMGLCALGGLVAWMQALREQP